VLAANLFIAANALAPSVLNAAQSYLFAAALGVLALLHLRPVAQYAVHGAAQPAEASAGFVPGGAARTA
jgi:hypothetical protein